MATSATRRILHIEKPDLKNIRNGQIGFETNGDLSYFQVANGFWGGKWYNDVSRFVSYDDMVRYERIHFKDAIIILPSGDDQKDATGNGTVDNWESPRPTASINIGPRAGVDVSASSSGTDEGLISIGMDASNASNINGTDFGNVPINIGNRAAYGARLLFSTLNVGREAGESCVDGLTFGASLTNLSGSSSNIGYQAGQNANESVCVFIGYQAGQNATSAIDSIGIGRLACSYGNVDASIGIGGRSLFMVQHSKRNIAIGWECMESTTSEESIAIGYQASWSAEHDKSVAIGMGTGNSQAVSTVMFGEGAGYGSYSTDTNNYNVDIGSFAGSSDVASLSNSASIKIGHGNSMGAIVDSSVSLGNWTNETSTEISHTVSIGDHALAATSANNTVAIGNYAGATVGTFDGNSTTYSPSVSAYDCVLIGTSAGFNENLNGVLIITNGEDELIRGDFTNGRLGIQDLMNLEPISSASVTPQTGDVIFDSGTSKLICWDGSSWNALW